MILILMMINEEILSSYLIMDWISIFSLSLVNLFLFHEIYRKKYLRKKDIWHKVYIMMEVKRKWHSSFKKGNGNLLTMCYCMKFKCMYIYTIWKMFYYNCWIRWMNLSINSTITCELIITKRNYIICKLYSLIDDTWNW